jgi:hypothetical protein
MYWTSPIKASRSWSRPEVWSGETGIFGFGNILALHHFTKSFDVSLLII